MRKDTRYIIKRRFKGSTLPELLVVMIISGILFLLLFNGLHIITQYSRILGERLSTKNELFYSHSILEQIIEDTDSIRLNDTEQMLLLYKNGEVKQTLLFNDYGIQVNYRELKDTLFTNGVEWILHSQNKDIRVIDSICVKVHINKDTLVLKYRLTNNNDLSNSQTAYADSY